MVIASAHFTHGFKYSFSFLIHEADLFPSAGLTEIHLNHILLLTKCHIYHTVAPLLSVIRHPHRYFPILFVTSLDRTDMRVGKGEEVRFSLTGGRYRMDVNAEESLYNAKEIRQCSLTCPLSARTHANQRDTHAC